MYANHSDPEPQFCASCRFFRPVDDDEIEDTDEIADDVGRCVRYPPKFYYAKLLNAEFPVVSAGTWCGEYERNPDI